MPASKFTTLAQSAPVGIGADLRGLRKARGWTLAELALRLGRSVGWLSQVERDRSEPTISDLRRIAQTFGVSISFFFASPDTPPEEHGHIVRRSARRALGDSAAGLVEELLSPDLGGAFEVVRSVFSPGAERAEILTRPTEEAGYVISGGLDLWIGERFFAVGPGDSFRFADEPFRWRNSGAEPAVVIWVISPPVY